MLAIGANAAFPVASIEFQSWEAGKGCQAGLPAHDEPKLEAHLTATPMTCDKAPLASQWDVDFYSFKAYLDTKTTFLCHGVEVYNTDDCSGELYFLATWTFPTLAPPCFISVPPMLTHF